MSGAPTTDASAATSSAIRSVNHGAMPVAAEMAGASAHPWRMRPTIRHSRVARREERLEVNRPAVGQLPRRVLPQPAAAAWLRASGSPLSRADPNSRSIAIASPVAFIWTPSERSAVGNLSNGHRGSFTTT